MPPIEIQDRTQRAVLWEASGTSDDYGKPKVIAPVEVLVRWDDTVSGSLDAQGNKTRVDATVTVDRAVPVDSIMRKGALVDVPVPPTGLYRVASYSEVPDVKGRNFRRTVSLVRHSNTLPEIVS